MFLMRTIALFLTVLGFRYCQCTSFDSCCMCLRAGAKTFYQTQAVSWNNSFCKDRDCNKIGISLVKSKKANGSNKSTALFGDLSSSRQNTLSLDPPVVVNNRNVNVKRVGFWMDTDRRKRLGFDTTFVELCGEKGIDIILLNFSIPLVEQGPFHAVIQDMTTMVAAAASGNTEASSALQSLEDFNMKHKEVVFVDPVAAAMNLCDRTIYYNFLRDLTLSNPYSSFFIPNFTILENKSEDLLLQQLQEANVPFPLVCKPKLAHGNEHCHEMILIFNREGLKDLQLPCIAQQFINHKAVLYKVYVMGKRHFITRRPSIKNLNSGDHETIFFNTDDVSKHYSKSPLTEADKNTVKVKALNSTLVADMVDTIRTRLGLTLFGIDVIVDADGHMAVIDVNYFPGYHCIDSAMQDLVDHILEMMSTA